MPSCFNLQAQESPLIPAPMMTAWAMRQLRIATKGTEFRDGGKILYFKRFSSVPKFRAPAPYRNLDM